MPLLHRKPFEPIQPPPHLKPDDEVFFCELTKEVFTDYERFFERTILCNSLVWSCSLTHRFNLTYQEALDCEKAAKKKCKMFPKPLQKPVLLLVRLMRRSRIEELNDAMFNFIKKRYFIGEELEVKVKTAKYECCRILDVFSTDLGSGVKSGSNGHQNSGGSSEEDDDKPLSKFVKPRALEPHEVTYQIRILGPCIEPVRIVPWSALRRKLKREQCKIFLKANCGQDMNPPRVYFVKKNVAKQLNLDNTKWENLFTGPEPVFSSRSPAKSKKGKANDNAAEEQGKHPEEQKSSDKKAKVKEDVLLQEIKRQEKEMKLEMKKREAEEARRLRMIAIEQRKKETKERLERMRVEREVEREEIKEVKRRLAEYKKEWSKIRDDLECDDLKDIPAPHEVVTTVPHHLFGDVISLLEFFHTFETLFDAKDEFPKGVSLDLLEKAIVDQDQDGPLCDFLFFFLSTIFRTHIEEEGETFYELEPGDKDLARSTPENQSYDRLVASATLAATWPVKYQGCVIDKLELDSYTVSEVLRVYLLSSAARPPADSRVWRAQQRGCYSLSDDTPLRMCLDRPDLIHKLSHTSIFNFEPDEKVEIFLCLSNHLLSYVTPRDYMEDMAEKLLAAQTDYREDKRGEKKRVKDAATDRWKWKNEQSLLEREARLKQQENISNENQPMEGSTVDNQRVRIKSIESDADKPKLMNREQQIEHLKMLDEEERVAKDAWEFRERKHLESIAKYQKYKVLPIGEDRYFRRYWTLNCVPGVLVEEYAHEHLTEELLMVKVNQQSQQSWTFSTTPTPTPPGVLANGVPSSTGHIAAIKTENDPALCATPESKNPSGPTSSISPLNGPANGEEEMSPNPSDGKRLQGSASRWYVYTEKEEIEQLMDSLNKRGIRESKLLESLHLHQRKIISTLGNGPSELCRKISERELGMRRARSQACPRAIELSLRDQILELESRIFEGTLGGIKDEDGYKWVQRVTHGYDYDPQFRELLLKSVRTHEANKTNGTLANGVAEEDAGEPAERLVDDELICPPDIGFPFEGIEDEEEDMEVDDERVSAEHKTSRRTVTDLSLALLQVERGIDRKYLKAPLGHSVDVAQRKTRSKVVPEDSQEEIEQRKRESEALLRRWELSLISSTSVSRVSLHLATLNRSIIWARSVLNACCKICKRKGDAEKMLLCDGCDRGHHMYCLRPALKNVPSGNWYCPNCKPKNSNRFSPRKVRTTSYSQQEASSEEEEEETENDESEEEEDDEEEEEDEEEESSEEEENDDDEDEEEEPAPRGLKYKITKKASRGRKSKNVSPEASTSKSRGRSAGRATEPIKGRGIDTGKRGRSQSERRSAQKRAAMEEEIDTKTSVNRRRSTGVWKDLNACQTLLKDLMAHKDSWPFLLPVSKKQVPDYYNIIKFPMDFATMQNKFKSIEYTDPAEFIADVKLVFSNCLLYNMPRSVHAKAAVQLGSFFEKKIRESGLEQYKDNGDNPPTKRRKS